MTAQAELCPPPSSVAEKQTALLCLLYELRTSLLMASESAARLGWLVGALELRMQHDALAITVANIEAKHPELL